MGGRDIIQVLQKSALRVVPLCSEGGKAQTSEVPRSSSGTGSVVMKAENLPTFK